MAGRLALLIALGLACASAVRAGEWTVTKTARADALVQQFLARVEAAAPGMPDASLALAIGTERALGLAKGYGEAQPGVPASAHTIYHVGSLAKQFTAAAVLDLIGRGARLADGTPLSLDLALSRVFKGVEHWPGADAGQGLQPVTVRSLLTMTSNLPNFTRLPPASTNPWGRIGAPELLSELKKLRPWGWPNTFEYSNTSYFLLAETIEEAILPGEAVPRAHRTYLRHNVFSRAGLIETGFVGDYAPGSPVARPIIHRERPAFDQPDWLKGSADVASSAADLYAWNAAFMGGRVVPKSLARLMVSDAARVTPELYYGMGWFVEHGADRDVFTHSGQVPGYTAYNLIAATRGDHGASLAGGPWISVTLLVNADRVEGLDMLAQDLLRIASE